MADTKISDLAAVTDVIGTDEYVLARSGDNKKIAADDLIAGLATLTEDGWVAAGETWTYASADDPTFTFTIAGIDLTGKYQAGQRIKLTQTLPKYFIITRVSFSTDTTITVYGGTDYDLANAAITAPYYSVAKAPLGFPLDPTKWTVQTSDNTLRTQATPSAGTWYNLGSFTISVPIGCWRLWYTASPQASDSSASDWVARCTLSTANNTESEPELTAQVYAGNVVAISITVSREKVVSLTSKTSYFLNANTPSSGLDNLLMRNDESYSSRAIIRAVCAYL